MKVIVGLGNPGKQFERNRHNVGFLFLDSLVFNFLHINDVFLYNEEFNACILYVKEYDLMLVKPHTFMNTSGEAVEKIKTRYNVNNKDLLVVVDEIYLPYGSIRYKNKGSDGGQNGMKNIISKIGDDFPRLRIGIGQDKSISLRDFVLSDFNYEEQNELEHIFNKSFLLLIDRFLKT